jgi:hypothetical protein
MVTVTFWLRRSWFAITLLLAALAPVACGGDTAKEDAAASAATAGAPEAEKKAAKALKVKTTTEPDDPCKWIPVAEVESIVGRLAAPPARKNGCLYTMVLPEAVAAKRQQQITQQDQLQEKLKAAFKDYEPPEYGGPMANYQRDPKNYAMSLSVDVSGDMASEIGMAAGAKILQSWLPPQSDSPRDARGDRPAANAKPEPSGWDSAQRVPYGFRGRVGHISIAVQAEAPDVPTEAMQALAARVRDRIPDLPFPATNPYQVIDLGGDHDPCSLLTRAEAEEVLGPLAVEPYPSSSYFPPLAHPEGRSCAYFTKGHHVFVLSPTWADGQESFGMEKGIGGLVGQVLPQETTVIKGPWDKAHMGMAGSLLFLKGDRLLEVHYMTSSTDRKGAIKLAAKAVPRLGAE